jgi:hypothetical protein
LEEFQSKCLPVISGFESTIQDYSVQLAQIKEMIKRFDEIMLTKASKISISEIFKELGNKF